MSDGEAPDRSDPARDNDAEHDDHPDQPTAPDVILDNEARAAFWATPRPDPYGLNAISESGAFRVLVAMTGSGPAEHARTPGPRPARTVSTRPPLPRTAQTTSNRPPMPRTAMTLPSAILDRFRATQEERRRTFARRQIEEFLAGLPTFTIDSDPAASGTRTTLAQRRERMAEDCAISGEHITVPCETVCGHIFEAESLARAWLIFFCCPLCRTPLDQWEIPLRHSDMHLLAGDCGAGNQKPDENKPES